MAITKTNAIVEQISVEGDVITTRVRYSLTEDSADLTSVRTEVVVSNATSDEVAAVQSVLNKAAVLAVA